MGVASAVYGHKTTPNHQLKTMMYYYWVVLLLISSSLFMPLHPGGRSARAGGPRWLHLYIWGLEGTRSLRPLSVPRLSFFINYSIWASLHGKSQESYGISCVDSRTHMTLFWQYSIGLGNSYGQIQDWCSQIKTAGRNINNLRHADDITLMTETKEDLKTLFVKVKEESEKLA